MNLSTGNQNLKIMNKLRKLILFQLLIFGFATGLWSEEVTPRSRSIEVIDVPTADVVDHYGFFVNFRFGSEGALQCKTAFGVFPRLNLGFGLDGEHVIGTEDARLNKPTINVKFRLFDGKGFLPALAIGYDGQGYIYNKTTDEYEQREKGFFLVGTTELFVKNLLATVGGNIYDFDEGHAARAFLGLSYEYKKTIGLLFEYDSLTEYDERRINYGLKYFITPDFTVDLIGRNIPEFLGSEGRETERIVRLNYTGSI